MLPKQVAYARLFYYLRNKKKENLSAKSNRPSKDA
jgi:hypothetical protein